MKEIVENDPLFKRLCARKQLAKNTYNGYVQALTKYSQSTGMTPTELRQQAYHEQKTIPDHIERQIETHLLNHYEYLKKQGLKTSTIVLHISKIRAFYTEYKIDLPKNIELTPDFEKKESDLIQLKHIRQVVNNTSNIKYKAIITLIASSGIRQIDIIQLTIQDFIDATRDYHNENNINQVIENLTEKEVIPIWEFTPQKTRRKKVKAITCSSPESTEFIITYLKTREHLKPKDKLFHTKYDEPYVDGAFGEIFRELNEKNAFGLNNKGQIFFHGSGLRDFFATTVNKSRVNYIFFKKMMGHSLSRVDTTYVHVDQSTVLSEYMKAVDNLSIAEVKVHDFKTKEYLKLEKQLEEKDQKYTQIKETQDNIAEQFTKILEFAQKDPEGFIKHMKKEEK